jgi:aryl-alcohol dehydrogenase-like predicted oxidoreductase
MQYRKFGPLDFEVSVVGFGAASISGSAGGYSFGDVSEADAIRLVHAVQDAGINLFDTAPIYGFGESERRLGKALAGARRARAFLVSKCGVDWDDQRNGGVDNSPDTTRRMLADSLRRLGTDHIDLYFIHFPDQNTDIRRTMEVLVEAKARGDIGAIGLSNTYPEDIARAQEIGPVDVLQSELNMFARYPVDALFEPVRGGGMGFMSYGTLAKGILTGRVTPDRTYDESDVRSHAPWWVGADHAPKFAAMARITPLLEAAGHTGLELALAHVLAFPETSTALCGVRTEAQLASAVAAVDHLPDSALLAEARQIVADEGAD